MSNSKRRCGTCRTYFEADQGKILGVEAFCSEDCLLKKQRTRGSAKATPSSANGVPRVPNGVPRVPKHRVNSFEREFQAVRPEVIAEAKGRCQARIPGICKSKGEHVHHRRLRSQGGTNEKSNLICLCFNCHEHIHAHPAWSYELGYLIPTMIGDPDVGEDLDH